MSEASLPPGPLGSRAGESDWATVRRALMVQARVLWALLLRESLTRGTGALALGWTSWLEPFVVVGEITVFFSLIERSPPYGDNMLLFVGTGVFPIYMFLHTSRRMRGPLAGSWAARFPIEMPLDVVAVHALLQFLGSATVAFAYFSVLYAMGIRSAAPTDLGAAMSALFSIFVLGVAMGMFNAMLSRVFPVWNIIWPPISRASLHFSGLYFVADYLTPVVRQYFAYNPLIHSVNWFRHAFYPFYPSVLNNHLYPIAAGAVMIVAALCLERVLNRQSFHSGDS